MADNPNFAPLCIWCSEPWSDDNVNVMVKAGSQACTYGYRSSVNVTFEIKCHKCKKLMYKKEARDCTSACGPEII